MIADFWTKTGSHYRANDVAQTVECVGPRPFAPHKVDNVTLGLGTLVVGRRALVTWEDGCGPFGKPVMITSVIERVEWATPSELGPKAAAVAANFGIPPEEALKIVASAAIPIPCLHRT